MIVEQINGWTTEIPKAIAMAYLIEEIEDSSGSYMMQTDNIIDELKELGFIKEEGFFDNVPTAFFNAKNLNVLLDFIHKSEVSKATINQDKDITIELDNGLILKMEVF